MIQPVEDLLKVKWLSRLGRICRLHMQLFP